MIDETLLRSLGILIVTAALFAAVARVVRMPAIVAYLLAGLVPPRSACRSSPVRSSQGSRSRHSPSVVWCADS